MNNEMPELKPGMVVEMNGEKYAVMQLDTGYTYGWGNDGRWCATFLKGTINKIWLMKRPNSINENMLGQSNLELIWERKPPVDWSKVAVDTKILVRNSNDEKWRKRYLATFDRGLFIVWNGGKTSFSAEYACDASSWRFAVLYEGNEHLVETNKTE